VPELSVSLNRPSSIVPGREANLSFRVTNTEAATATSVTLLGEITGAEVIAITTNVGSCTGGTSMVCELGDLAPAATVDVVATVRPPSGSDTVSVTASVQAAESCEANTADNTITDAIAVKEVEPTDPNQPGLGPELVPSGGCGCVVVEPGGDARGAWGALALLGLALRLRARRKLGR